MTLPFTAALLGVLAAGSIFYLVRRDHLHGGQAVWWLLVASAALAFGFIPNLVDRLGVAFGVSYPPMLLAIISLIAVGLKLLYNDIEMARKERRLRRLTQKLALLEYELRQQRGAGESAGSAESTGSESRNAKHVRR